MVAFPQKREQKGVEERFGTKPEPATKSQSVQSVQSRNGVDTLHLLRPDGRREILGFWLFGAEGESATNWRQVVRELGERGVRGVKLFESVLPGIEEAVREIFPSSKWQLCVLHTVRDTLAKVRKKDREALAQDLKVVYRVDTIEQARQALRALEEKWAAKYRSLWLSGWTKATP